MKSENTSIKEFFASANGCNGFKSYFEEIFNSSHFDRIFVLKGGPGTGKSTLMKKTFNALKSKKLNFEIFRCSSDSNSLDGLILEDEKSRVAIIDGTAPHERDAVVPGATDVLVNLGEAIRNDSMKELKSEVLELNRLKRNAYIGAYKELSKNAILRINLEAEIQSIVDETLVDAFVDNLVKSFNIENGTSGVRLLSSFSKDGYASLRAFEGSKINCLKIGGEYESETVIITLIAQKLTKKGIPYVRIPSPFLDGVLEGVYFPQDEFAIIASKESYTCNSLEFLKIKSEKALTQRARALKECITAYESEAQRFLAEASAYHFELEKLYTAEVDFSIVDFYTDRIIDYASKIFI